MMTITEARELARKNGTDQIKYCLDLFDNLCDDDTIDFGATYPSGKLFFRVRTHDLSGTFYSAKHFINHKEAMVLYLLQLSPWGFEEISKEDELYNDCVANFEEFLNG